jgi:hypothetical protein
MGNMSYAEIYQIITDLTAEDMFELILVLL